jgi:hypothetical protein
MVKNTEGGIMTYFKDYTFHWWEFGLLKISLLALGILAGSYWAGFFSAKNINLMLWAIFFIPAVYLVIAAFKQAGQK